MTKVIAVFIPCRNWAFSPAPLILLPNLHGGDEQDHGQHGEEERIRHQPEELTADKTADDRPRRASRLR